jgi:tryptophan synthase alpha chain
MSRLKNLFAKKPGNILNIYCTAGYPHIDSTMEIMKALQDHGVDIIELGMPYSDPLADGPVIQKSSAVALGNGMTIAKLFAQLKEFRKQVSIPVILMGYLNPILQYGFARFCKDAATIGIDGLIIPDLPQHEFENEYGGIIKEQGLDFIFLITPETGIDRIHQLDKLSTGFLYAVSSSSTTGSANVKPGKEEYFQKLKSLDLQNPVLVGFGIRDKAGFNAVCQFAAGGIIGSGFIKALENSGDVKATTKSFLSSLID